MTPAETLVDVLSNPKIDEMEAVLVIYRTGDGIIGYRTSDGLHVAVTLGLLAFTQMSVQHDLKRTWDDA
jgi:hypothetical protein